MSRTNCLLPNSGFCLNLRVRIVKSLMASGGLGLASVAQRKAANLITLGQDGLS